MKKLFTSLSLLAMLALSAQSFAATTADLLLQGTVAADMQISFVPAPLASALALQSSADQIVGDLKYMSNSPSGFEISIGSTNFGKMKHTNGVDLIGYELKTADAVAIQLAKDGVLEGVKIESFDGIPVDITKSLIFVSANVMKAPGLNALQMVAGSYSDTVHASIAAK